MFPQIGTNCTSHTTSSPVGPEVPGQDGRFVFGGPFKADLEFLVGFVRVAINELVNRVL
jgi:hypothetical protein